jgi:hypothetical protein
VLTASAIGLTIAQGTRLGEIPMSDFDEQRKPASEFEDSLSRDVLMAKRAHCYAIWAKYGAHTDVQMYERLIRISHWTAEDILNEKNYAREAKNYSPDFTCQRSIAEIRTLLPGK